MQKHDKSKNKPKKEQCDTCDYKEYCNAKKNIEPYECIRTKRKEYGLG